jgi:hypothetical protein
VDERDETRRTDRRDFLRKLGLGAAVVVAAPAALSGCNPYQLHH